MYVETFMFIVLDMKDSQDKSDQAMEKNCKCWISFENFQVILKISQARLGRLAKKRRTQKNFERFPLPHK